MSQRLETILEEVRPLDIFISCINKYLYLQLLIQLHNWINDSINELQKALPLQRPIIPVVSLFAIFILVTFKLTNRHIERVSLLFKLSPALSYALYRLFQENMS